MHPPTQPTPTRWHPFPCTHPPNIHTTQPTRWHPFPCTHPPNIHTVTPLPMHPPTPHPPSPHPHGDTPSHAPTHPTSTRDTPSHAPTHHPPTQPTPTRTPLAYYGKDDPCRPFGGGGEFPPLFCPNLGGQYPPPPASYAHAALQPNWCIERLEWTLYINLWPTDTFR